MTKLIQVTDSIYCIEGQGGNIGALIGYEGILLIDDQFAHLHDDIITSLSNISSKTVKYVINTHWHVDHTNGNELFGAEGSIIIAQKNSALRMQSPQRIEVFQHTQLPYSPEGLPKIKFQKQYKLEFNNEEIDLIAIEHAHTDGDLIVHFKKSNVIHAGDIFVTYGYPFIDTPNGGTIQGVIKGIDRIISLSNEHTKIIPGHGYVSTKQDLINYKIMLETILNRIKLELSKGKTRDEILATKPTRGFDSEKINETIFTDIILESLEISKVSKNNS
ncbi:MBL fold metallo-hydrolase [Wenyingzhuangia sp. IMCC45574]